MEDAPYRNTRSSQGSTGSVKKGQDETLELSQ